MKQDLANNLADTRNGGDVKKNGKFHHSIVSDVLLATELNVVPLPLHLSLGCVYVHWI